MTPFPIRCLERQLHTVQTALHREARQRDELAAAYQASAPDCPHRPELLQALLETHAAVKAQAARWATLWLRREDHRIATAPLMPRISKETRDWLHREAIQSGHVPLERVQDGGALGRYATGAA